MKFEMTQEERDALNAIPEKEYAEMELKYAKEQVEYWENRVKQS